MLLKRLAENPYPCGSGFLALCRRRRALASTRRLLLTVFTATGVALAAAGSSQADIYKTVGPDGVISFTSSPKKGGKLYARAEAPAVHMPSDASPGRRDRYDEHIGQGAALYRNPRGAGARRNQGRKRFRSARRLARERTRPDAADSCDRRPHAGDGRVDPRQNIFGGVRYLRVLANLFNGDIELTLAGYNAGEGAVIRHGGIPPYPETVNYVKRVLAHYRDYRAATSTPR